ncbi:MAG: biotin transporter BioY [Clostridia bacterium]|nr:biotin transporter BioY [Clostridia bacterium]
MGKMKTAKINQLVYAALMATLISVCAWITVPIGPVPFTLQTFGVFCALCTLGGAWGTVSVLVYLGLGLIGLPVFSGFTGGVGKLAGPTGGYLIGFIFAALAFWGVTALFGTGPLPSLLGMALGNFLCYAFGTAWFMLAASSKPSLAAALTMCVLPYVVPDLIKIACAYLFAKALKARLGKRVRM